MRLIWLTWLILGVFILNASGTSFWRKRATGVASEIEETDCPDGQYFSERLGKCVVLRHHRGGGIGKK